MSLTFQEILADLQQITFRTSPSTEEKAFSASDSIEIENKQQEEDDEEQIIKKEETQFDSSTFLHIYRQLLARKTVLTGTITTTLESTRKAAAAIVRTLAPASL